EHYNAHLFSQSTQETIDKFRKLSQGQRIGNYGLSTKRLYGDRPSPTVTTKNFFVHPTENRLLTPRELARLQSFPDNFLFEGTKTAMVKQIGNAVPPLLAEAIARKILEVSAYEK
ncbi:MAG: DNA cytosine methyltransferase, partial [Nanoarchaeota archaeon]